MKTIIGILLVGLLGFLGCSDSNDGTSTFNGEAIPVAPFGITDTITPAYEWTPVPGATRYHLLVEENDVPVIEEWYTAEEGECASEDGLCSVTPDVNVGGATWKVLACAGEECGLWSDELQFSYIVAGPTPPRFIDNGDGTVTDNNTMLMWSKWASLHEPMSWEEANAFCEKELMLARYTDWRLPSISELNSLIDLSQYEPALPAGHPFLNVQDNCYWSSSAHSLLYSFDAWTVYVPTGKVWAFVKTMNFCGWCVRGGH